MAAGARLEQGRAVARCSSGLPAVETCRDYGGNERLTLDVSHVMLSVLFNVHISALALWSVGLRCVTGGVTATRA
jgi:hypothetical protein